MTVRTAVENGFPAAYGIAKGDAAKTTSRKPFWTRMFDRMSANAEQQALARLALIDPRLQAEVLAARDRAEIENVVSK